MSIVKNIILSFLLLVLFSLSLSLEIGKNKVNDPVPNFKYYSRWYESENKHYGADIVGSKKAEIKDANVYPALKGKVLAVEDKGERGYGKVVMIDHGVIVDKGYVSLYAHLDSYNVKVGEEVDENTVIGKVGNTGKVSGKDKDPDAGYHLHYEVREYDPDSPPQNYSEVCSKSTPVNPGDPVSEGYTKQKGAKGGGDGDSGDDSLSETEGGEGGPGGSGGPGGGGGGAGGLGGNPGNDAPDDNQSFSSSLSLNPKDPRASFFRLAGKKGKVYVLKYWEYLKVMDEREDYFESLSAGGTPDESYLESLNKRIEELYEELQSGEFGRERSETPDIVILRNGYFFESSNFSGKFSEPWRRVSTPFSPISVRENPVMIIPSGGLFGLENSEAFKAVLKDYVEKGGFLIVFSQQHGYEFNVLPTPDGKPIKAYGWREDLSCHITSVYLSSEHPTLSGMLRTNPSIAVDGYFEEIPEGSVVLLRRVKNGYPVAFYYQYGAGYVFVTSMYEDWGSANYQSTSEGRAFVRDLITWAKKPQALPTYNLSENPNPNISLNLEIKNTSDKKAEKVKISWLDPDRNLVAEEEYSISLNPGEILTFPISRSISHQYRFGIWHIDFIPNILKNLTNSNRV